MFPIMLDVSKLRIALVGNGAATLRRLKLLQEAGAEHIRIFADAPNATLKQHAGVLLKEHFPDEKALRDFQVIMAAELPEKQAKWLADTARKMKILVNVEDVKPQCDFFFPSLVRRGELVLTVSTGGASPALAKRIRGYLADVFPESWAQNVRELGAKREQWKSAGKSFDEVAKLSNEYIDEQGWLSDAPRKEAS